MSEPPASTGPFHDRDPFRPFGAPEGVSSTPPHPDWQQPAWRGTAAPSTTGGSTAASSAPATPATASPAPAALEQYRAPRRRWLWFLVPLLVALLALLAWAALRMSSSSPGTGTTPTPSATPSTQNVPSAAASPTPGVAASSIPFTNETDNTSGTFTITGHSWTTQGLLVHVQVHLDRGSQRLGFFAINNDGTAQVYNPTNSGSDYLEGQTASAGETRTGTVLFVKPQGTTTVWVTDSQGRQVAALLVKG